MEVIRIARPFIPWVGGKEKLIPLIVQLFPPEIKTYVELFGGSGSMLLGMQPKASRLDIYNDLDSDLSNLFLCVRDRLIELLAELKFLPIHSRTVFELFKHFLAHEEVQWEVFERHIQSERALLENRAYFTEEQAEELRPILNKRARLFDVERAAVFYRSIRGSFSGTVTSFGLRSLPIVRFLYLMEQASKRLQEVAIENKSATQLMTEKDDETTLFYGDPPYFEAEKLYRMRFHRKLHIRLWQKACACRGYVVLSYNDCPFIRQLYQDFYILAFKRGNPLAHKKGSEYGELIITNYDPRPLMTPDELKALPKGEFIVMKTGCHPMRTRLRLFLEWGITFEEPYIVPPRENAQVRYAGRRELMNSIMQRYEFAQSRSGVMPLDSEKGERNKNAAGMKT